MATPKNIPPYLTENARRLRRESTVPERILWGLLRNGGIGGLKFRRQQPIGPSIVDFICFDARLVVELDGLSHVGAGQKDDTRTRVLESKGLRVVRFTNDELLSDPESVAVAIARAAGLDW